MPDYKLPDVGEGLTEAELVSWRVAVGDTIAINDIVCEIETAKSIVELPSPYAGEVAALLVQPGETVEVGTPIITVGSASEQSAVAEEVARRPSRSPDSQPDSQRDSQPDSQPDNAELDLSNPAATGGGEGESLVGRMKADRGAIRRPRRVPSGEVATHMQAQAAFEPGAAAPMVEAEEPESAVPAVSARSTEPTQQRDAAEVRVLAKPPVRKLAKNLGVDLATLAGTGPGGSISRADVEGAVGGSGASGSEVSRPLVPRGTSTTDRETREPVKGVRKMMAGAMTASAFTAPHVTEWVTVDVTRTVDFVERLRGRREFRDVKISPLLVLARATMLAMRRTPIINSTWDEATSEVVTKHYVNLGIAAATPRGLVVPNVKDAQDLSLHDLATALGELTAVARDGRTQPADMAGGTFTITNVGVFGIDSGTPIINPGESSILAFGAIRKQPWVVTEGGEDQIAIRHVTTLALSFDHRHIDGEAGSRYLADVAAVLEDPATALLF